MERSESSGDISQVPICPKCGRECQRKMEAEECSTIVENRTVAAVQRNFIAVCPSCGPVWYPKFGHHGTLLASHLSKLFPKNERERLYAALPDEERKLLKKSLQGKRVPTEREMERWQGLLSSLRKTSDPN